MTLSMSPRARYTQRAPKTIKIISFKRSSEDPLGSKREEERGGDGGESAGRRGREGVERGTESGKMVRSVVKGGRREREREREGENG